MIVVDYPSIFRSGALEKFHVHTTLSQNVGLLRLFPSITDELVKAFLRSPTEGVVLQSYGAGNIPSNRQDIVTVIKEATTRGVIIVNITQCATGSVENIYEAGQILVDAGNKLLLLFLVSLCCLYFHLAFIKVFLILFLIWLILLFSLTIANYYLRSDFRLRYDTRSGFN